MNFFENNFIFEDHNAEVLVPLRGDALDTLDFILRESDGVISYDSCHADVNKNTVSCCQIMLYHIVVYIDLWQFLCIMLNLLKSLIGLNRLH